MKTHINLSGQFQIIKKDSQGHVMLDTGVVNNMILDSGLDFFGGTSNKNIMEYLAVGTGNSEPKATQNRLDNVVKMSSSTQRNGSYIHASQEQYDQEQDGDYYTVSVTRKYVFNELNNVNISEIGLVSELNLVNYTAYTRALIKDDSNRPITITVLQGESLEVYYTLKQVFHLPEVTGQLELSDGRGGGRGTLTYSMKLAAIGGEYKISGLPKAVYRDIVGLSLNNYTNPKVYETQTLGAINSEPTGKSMIFYYFRTTFQDYVSRSYKKQITITLNENQDIPKLGSVLLFTTMGFYQIAFVPTNGVLAKDLTQTFGVTLEVSWGRDTRGS